MKKLIVATKDSPAPLATCHLLALRMHELAAWFMERNRPKDAWPWLVEAVLQEEKALREGPTLEVLRQSLLLHHEALTEALLRLDDHEAAAKSLQEQAKLVGTGPWPKRPEAALLMARCAALAAKDANLAESARMKMAANYGDLAIAWLTVAVDKGFTDANFLKKEDFAPLRDRPAFKKLQEKLAGP